MSFNRPRLALAFALLPLLAGCHRSEPAAAPVATAVAPGRPVQPVQPVQPQLKLEVEGSQSVVATGKPSELFVRVRIAGLTLPGAKRPPINLGLVVDTSGSMAGPAIERAKEACGALVDALGPADTLSIVTFGSKADVALAASRLDDKARAAAKKSIASMKAEGTTEMSGGLSAGIGQVRSFLSGERINRIVLVGDGIPNDASTMPGLAEQARGMNVPITALGLGPDFDETLMTNVARTSGGTFHFVEDAAAVAGVFEREIATMQRLVAKGATVDLTPGPGVEIFEVVGFEATPVGRAARFVVGDLAEGQSRDAIVRVRVRDHKEGANVELLDATVRYTHASAGVSLTDQTFLGLVARSNEAAVTESRKPEIEHEAARLRVADGIVRAIALARGGDVPGARALLDRTIAIASSAAKTFGDAELGAKADEARKLKKTVASLAPPPETFAASPGAVNNAPPAPKPMAPETSMAIKTAHGGAMRDLQGM